MRLSAVAGAAALVIVLCIPAPPAVALAGGFGKLTGMLGKSKDMGEINETQEIEIGGGIASTLLGAAPLVKDKGVQEYVNKVGLWLALQTERPNLPWHFGVLDSSSVNAFATPGGYVFITRGLLQRMHNEDELAGVLAHEISHVLRKHHLVAIQKSAKRGLMKDALGMVASNRGGLQGQAMDKVLNAGIELYARGLDKADEYEADRMGVVIAARAGYDPYGLPAVLQTLDGISAKDSTLSLMFKTHPTPASRLLALDQTMGTHMDAFGAGTVANPRFAKVTRQ